MEPKKNFVVNGRLKHSYQRELSYSDLCIFAFGTYTDNPNITYTITYKRGLYGAEGMMHKDDWIGIVDGMIFNIAATERS